MGNFKSTFATDNRVESTIHFVNRYIRMKTNQIKTKKVESDFFVMSGDTVEAVIKAYQNRNAKTALVIGDLGLQITNRLLQEGVTNITVALVRLPVEHVANVKATLKRTFPTISCNIISMKELEDMSNKEFDLVIANPPYGKIGASITKKIIDTVDFKEYVNLLPMVDYEKAANKYELWKHVYSDSISACPGGFDDAGISPLIVKLSAKATANTFTIDEFRVQCIEKVLARKYFSGNIKRNAAFFLAEQFKDLSLTKCIALPVRTKSGNHGGQAGLGKTDKSQFYLINKNIKQSVTTEETKSICCTTVNFDTELEKQNAAKLLYSDVGYRFASWLMTDMNRDAFHLREHAMWFPKVDWTRSWTVEEILADYGYTEDEIKAVMDDLKNYKGMED